jgi:hypothetical protein
MIRTALLALLGLSLSVAVSGAEAQLRASWSEGQNISPAYEGWEENEDGSFNIVFGYMNRNWDEELHIPVGPDNHFEPGLPDRGQPTYFQPRRNRFTFKVRVPADFGDQELVWTITSNGITEKAYGSLARDYKIDNIVIMSETGALGAGTSDPLIRANQPPRIELETPRTLTARIGEPVRIAARIVDETPLPERGVSRPAEDATPQDLLARALVPPRRSTVSKATGLHFGWFVYRGPQAASFDPPQVKTWEDTRAFQNSPWSAYWIPPELPEDRRWVSEVTFHEPGTYVLRGRADDGGLFADEEITVTVTR